MSSQVVVEWVLATAILKSLPSSFPVNTRPWIQGEEEEGEEGGGAMVD